MFLMFFTLRFNFLFQLTRRLDKHTGVSTVKYTLDTKNELFIEGTPVTVLNVYLECDLDMTPWCLQPQDHIELERRKKESSNNAGI